MNCAVVIVNYNTGDMLKQVVDSVLGEQCVDKVVVVDNKSADDSMALLPDNSKLDKYYRSKNHGFASSCNFGAKRCDSDYILFLNPDCFIANNSLSVLINNLYQNPQAAIIGCNVQNPDGSEQRASRRRLPTLWRAIKTFSKIENFAKTCNCFAGVNLIHQPMPKNIQKVEAISGAFILIKTEKFKQVNGFDNKFPLHFEDLDLFKRIADCGYDILFNPTIKMIHHQGISSRSNPKVSGFKIQGLKRYFKKHCSPLAYYFIKIIIKVL